MTGKSRQHPFVGEGGLHRDRLDVCPMLRCTARSFRRRAECTPACQAKYRGVGTVGTDKAHRLCRQRGGWMRSDVARVGRSLADEPDWRERARKFSAKCVDWSYVLNLRVVTLPHAASESRASTEWHTAIEPVSEKVAYQPSCHMTHVQKNVAAPLALIRSVPGAKLVTMDGADMCCGSAGTYNIVRYKQSMDILDRKMQALIQSGADTVIATNPGCLLQLQIGIHRSKLERKVRAMHLAEWLEESMLDSSSGRSSPYNTLAVR